EGKTRAHGHTDARPHQLRYGLPGPALHRAALLRALGQGYLRSPILRLPLGSGSPTGAFLRRPRGTSRAMWSSRVIRLPTSAIEEEFTRSGIAASRLRHLVRGGAGEKLQPATSLQRPAGGLPLTGRRDSVRKGLTRCAGAKDAKLAHKIKDNVTRAW